MCARNPLPPRQRPLPPWNLPDLQALAPRSRQELVAPQPDPCLLTKFYLALSDPAPPWWGRPPTQATPRYPARGAEARDRGEHCAWEGAARGQAGCPDPDWSWIRGTSAGPRGYPLREPAPARRAPPRGAARSGRPPPRTTGARPEGPRRWLEVAHLEQAELVLADLVLDASVPLFARLHRVKASGLGPAWLKPFCRRVLTL